MQQIKDTVGPQMARLDPRASKFRYRLERLMLTPLFRFSLRVVLPGVVAFAAATAWFSVPDNREAFSLMLSDMRAQIESRPEFQVRLMAIDGASAEVAETIRTILPIDFPISSFDLNLDAMQDLVAGLDAVQSARVQVRQGGVLQVDVTQRVPAVLWRFDGGLDILDASGVVVGAARHRSDYPALPVIAGEDAEDAVQEALALQRAAAPIAARLRGFERMGGRRWDVVLDRGQRILLPEQGAQEALERAIAMDQAVDMLSRDLVAVDLRLPQRPTIRMTAEATEQMWTFKAIEAGGVIGQ